MIMNIKTLARLVKFCFDRVQGDYGTDCMSTGAICLMYMALGDNYAAALYINRLKERIKEARFNGYIMKRDC